ncbi:MAG: flagellar basal body P-ring formation chaperone FlgA [Rhodobacteraceae bacterium]|nr:flagellar basal body P-ring formation chaperone FlgA [Paracoccaceae bacterium]
MGPLRHPSLTTSISSKMRHLWVIICGFVVLPLVAASEPHVISGEDVRRAIVKRLTEAGEHAAPNVLPEKQFYVCDQPLEVQPAFGGWRSVSVVCPSPVEWKIVVRAQVKSAGLPDAQGGDVATAQAVFLNRPLRRGDRIQSGDVELRPIDPLSSGSVFADPEDVIGRVLTQSITTHVPLMPRHLLREWAVEADDALSLVILRGGIEVISTGIALEAGQFGDTIRVLNATSGVELLGKVVGDKKVEIVSKSLR